MNGAQHIDREVYDDEAFIGTEEGEVMDGKVVQDLDDDGEKLQQCCHDMSSLLPADTLPARSYMQLRM
jgi:hypothetical protein